MKIKKERCEVCSENNKKILDAHHVIPRSDPRSTDKRDNLICVCSNCHRRIHAGEVIIEGWYSTTQGKVWFWHFDGEPWVMRPGVFLNEDGTATIVEAGSDDER